MPAPRDDRDQPCSVARLSNRQLAWRSIGIKSLTRDEYIKKEQQVTINTEVAIALLGGVLGWVLWTAFAMLVIQVKGSLLINFVYPMISSIVVSTLIWFYSLGWVRAKKFDKIAQLQLDLGNCAGCGYALVDLLTEEDGCRVCPECNAAWKADRIGLQKETTKYE